MTVPSLGHAIGMATVVLFSGYAAAQARLSEVVVTGNPLGGSDVAAPVSQLSGDGLLLRGRSTLGELLDGTPGVSSTYFGPNASRPVIRGLDGDRLRLLSNSGAGLDASGLSYDQAVVQASQVLDGALHRYAEKPDGHNAHDALLADLFASHSEGSADCLAFDQLSHFDTLVSFSLALPMVLTPFQLTASAGLAVARWHAQFQARGPPFPH